MAEKKRIKLESVFDESFREFGQIVRGYDLSELLKTLEESTPMPEEGVVYVTSEPKLESLPIFEDLAQGYFGGMPIQLGYCNGHNTKLNGVEYHRDSEVNIAATDIIVLIGRQADINPDDFTFDTSKTRAFSVPAGTAFEFYATTLHYAPCEASPVGFKVGVVLPRGTNEQKPGRVASTEEDKLLAAANKWLIVHPEAAGSGLYTGLVGENIDVSSLQKK
ncbi:MAG: DUF4867 family protein [Synergistaceae bacterium]|nr:DUF4867 family protein [Synergistaceae bacterium]